jgi:hypothetical protein
LNRGYALLLTKILGRANPSYFEISIVRGFKAVFDFGVDFFFFGSFQSRIAGDTVSECAIVFVLPRFFGGVKRFAAE